MEIVEIIQVNKQRSKIVLDTGESFILYKGELRILKLKQGSQLSDETYKNIVKGILPKRCKLRAMNLLKTKDYTSYQLKSKLMESGYPEYIAEEALEYVKQYGYVNDSRYASDYVKSKIQTTGRNEIKQKLIRKGLSKEVIDGAFLQCEEEDISGRELWQMEAEVIRKALIKKGYNHELAYEEKQKILAYFYRRGFDIELVRRVMDEHLT